MEQKEFRINKRFEPLLTNRDRRIILYGSRSSSKSDFVSRLIFKRMLEDKDFFGIAVRNVMDNNRGSTYKAMVDVIAEYGMEQFFSCILTPMEIVCKHNGNKLIFKGLDDVTKIKSLKNVTFCWWEEEVPRTYEEYLTVSLTLRSPKAEYLQEIFTINPYFKDCPNYEEHWLYRKYFQGHDDLSYRIVDVVDYEGKKYESYTTVHYSSWRDNYWCPMQERIALEALKDGDEYTYRRDSLGMWSRPDIVGQFYKDFRLTRNTVQSRQYNNKLALHLSFDHNNNPYSACTVYQCDPVDARKIYQIDEVCLKSPNNKLMSVLDAICLKYRDHDAQMYVYGDPNGYKEDSTKEQGDNAYRMIMGRLSRFKPVLRAERSAPSVRARQNWLNDVFLSDWNELRVYISLECRNSINDFTMLREDPVKGGKLKEKWKDPETDIVCEKYGHTSDSFEYFLCVLFKDDFEMHKNGGMVPKFSTGPITKGLRNNRW